MTGESKHPFPGSMWPNTKPSSHGPRYHVIAGALAVLALSATVAFADGAADKLVTDADKARLAAYDQTRTQALGEARAGGTRTDLAVLEGVIAPAPVAFSGAVLAGNWQCRTIKVGGLSPLVVYSWFRCRVSADGSGWILEKISGSQRTKGRLYTDTSNRLVYLGTGFVAGEPAKPYGSGPASDQVGYAFRTGPKSWRIEFPAPHYESKLDILEFKP